VKLVDLFLQVPDHSVDLLDHRFHQDLDFGADFDRGQVTAGDDVAGFFECSDAGIPLAERAIGPTGADPRESTGDIDGAALAFDAADDFGGLAQIVKVFIELSSNQIAYCGIAMQVGAIAKNILEGLQETEVQ
jgi:hypothetical protein